MFRTSIDQIYKWRNSEPMPRQKAKIRDDLVSAAKHIEAAGFGNDRLLFRRFIDGKTLPVLVHDGGSACEAAALLVSYLEQEPVERNRLHERLAGREPSTPMYFDPP